jgi:hypothetical protein
MKRYHLAPCALALAVFLASAAFVPIVIRWFVVRVLHAQSSSGYAITLHDTLVWMLSFAWPFLVLADISVSLALAAIAYLLSFLWLTD